ncbi:unnamed protein product [Closterium sp. Yama58-4]|nr:unnamed protein product [Closterium sp. Yama58-4]
MACEPSILGCDDYSLFVAQRPRLFLPLGRDVESHSPPPPPSLVRQLAPLGEHSSRSNKSSLSAAGTISCYAVEHLTHDDSPDLEGGNAVAALQGAAPLCSLVQRGDSEASVGNAADLSLSHPMRQSFSHSDAGDREEDSPGEDFHSWVATSQCRAERRGGGGAARKAAGKGAGKAAQPAGPRSPFTAGAAAAAIAAAVAEAQQEDEQLGIGCAMASCGTATATTTANATGRSSASLSTSGRRMSINRRRNAMDYSELDAVRERLKQAASMWAIATPNCDEDDGADSESSDGSDDGDDTSDADAATSRDGRALWGSSSEEASSGAGTSGEESPAEQICVRAGLRKSVDQQQQQKEQQQQLQQRQQQQQQQQGMGMTQRRSASALWQLLLPGARR